MTPRLTKKLLDYFDGIAVDQEAGICVEHRVCDAVLELIFGIVGNQSVDREPSCSYDATTAKD